MGRANVNYNGKWACFSSIPDAFITKFMDRPEYDKWREKEYGNNACEIYEHNTFTIKQAGFCILLNRTHDEAVATLLETGLTKTECEQIIYDIETQYRCPRPNGNGKYRCPNCGIEVEYGQEICPKDGCEIKFVWRD